MFEPHVSVSLSFDSYNIFRCYIRNTVLSFFFSHVFCWCYIGNVFFTSCKCLNRGRVSCEYVFMFVFFFGSFRYVTFFFTCNIHKDDWNESWVLLEVFCVDQFWFGDMFEMKVFSVWGGKQICGYSVDLWCGHMFEFICLMNRNS